MNTTRALAAAAVLVAVAATPGNAQLPTLIPGCFDTWATIVGTEGDDVLTGTSGDDVIAALEGDDVVRGLGGNDSICAGPGADEVVGGAGGDAIAVGRGADEGLGGPGRDIVVEFTSDSCSPCLPADPASRDNSVDHISGGPGGDAVAAEGGNDVIDGGPGEDLALHLSRFTSITVDLTLGTAASSAGDVDALSGIEHVVGSVNGDQLRGDEHGNHLMGVGFFGQDVIVGEDGPDMLFAEAAGALLVGGADEAPDTVQFALQEPAMMDLAAGIAASRETSHAHTPDVIAGFENAVGTAYDDVIAGDEAANLLEGGFGHDELSGRGGNDYLFGDYRGRQPLAWGAMAPGNDLLDGGTGDDRLDGGPLIDECLNGEEYVSCEQRDAPSSEAAPTAPRGSLPWWWSRLDIDYLHELPAIAELLASLR